MTGCVRLLLATFVAMLIVSDAARPDCSESGHKPGNYSELSIDLCFQDIDNEQRVLKIPSPDHSIMLIVDGQWARFRQKGRDIGSRLAINQNESIIWSPDSRALIVTSSFGAGGPTSSGVIFIRQNFFPEVPDIQRAIKTDFAGQHPDDPCRNEVNVVGLTWLDLSKEAVFVAMDPPSPGCSQTGGYFDAYVMSIPDGRIAARYSMEEAEKRWSNVLGPALREAVKLVKEERDLRTKTPRANSIN